jgi:hypothetical protein
MLYVRWFLARRLHIIINRGVLAAVVFRVLSFRLSENAEIEVHKTVCLPVTFYKGRTQIEGV